MSERAQRWRAGRFMDAIVSMDTSADTSFLAVYTYLSIRRQLYPQTVVSCIPLIVVYPHTAQSMQYTPPAGGTHPEQSACISVLEISYQAPIVRVPPAPATGSITACAAHVDPAPLPPQSVANISSRKRYLLTDFRVLVMTQNVTKCVSHTSYAVSTGATGRFYHLVSCADRYRAGGPRGSLTGGRQVP